MSELPATIMIIDDTPANLEVLAEFLTGEGYEVRAFPSGKLALRSIEKSPPDLILLDVVMPEMDGFEVSRRMKANDGPDIPIIFISALDNIHEKVKAFEHGGVDYITKPIQFKEVAHRVKTHLTIARQRTQLEARNRLKDRFMRIAAHDLRNPLTAIMANIDILEFKFPELIANKRAWSTIQEILHATHTMADVINEFLDFDGFDSGRKTEKHDPLSIIFKVVDQNRSIASRKQISIVLESDGLPCIIEATPARLHQVATNFLSNAVEYSPIGSWVFVRTKFDGTRFRMEIEDQGPGIPENERDLLFQEFKTLSTEPTGGERRSGLGLWIARNLALMMGGQVGCSFPENGGSIFWLELSAIASPVGATPEKAIFKDPSTADS